MGELPTLERFIEINHDLGTYEVREGFTSHTVSALGALFENTKISHPIASGRLSDLGVGRREGEER